MNSGCHYQQNNNKSFANRAGTEKNKFSRSGIQLLFWPVTHCFGKGHEPGQLVFLFSCQAAGLSGSAARA